MDKFQEIFLTCDKLTHHEDKPLSAVVAHLTTEVGELAEASLITEGHIKHKELSEPVAGEVADVVQCAISVLVKATPSLTAQERYELFLRFFEKKTNKWAGLQQEGTTWEGEAEEGWDNVTSKRTLRNIDTDPNRNQDITAVPTAERTKRIIAEQMGISVRDLRSESDLVHDIGADSLDLIELAMAVEDEYDMEISDGDAEKLKTVADVVLYVHAHLTEDPAAGRHLSLEERMNERSLSRKDNDYEGF